MPAGRLVGNGQPLKRGGKKEDILPENPLDAARLKTLARRQEVGGEIPSGVLKPAIEALVEKWGARPAQAEVILPPRPVFTPGAVPP